MAMAMGSGTARPQAHISTPLYTEHAHNMDDWTRGSNTSPDAICAGQFFRERVRGCEGMLGRCGKP